MMCSVDEADVLLRREPVDFRDSIDGPSITAEEEFGLGSFSQRIFALTNRKNDRVKPSCRDRSSFALWLKRLEKARFPCDGCLLSNSLTDFAGHLAFS